LRPASHKENRKTAERLNQMRDPLRQHPHPDEKKLLLLLDSELKSREARPIRMHLERCRACRAKMQTMRQGLFALEEYGQAAFPPLTGAPPKGWSEFRALLNRESTSSGSKSHHR
jgi:hypothetical protein